MVFLVGLKRAAGKGFWDGSVSLQTLLALDGYRGGWVCCYLGVSYRTSPWNGLLSENQLWVDYFSEIL